MRLLGLSGSLRRDSLNTALLRSLQELAPDNVEFALFDYRDVPLYDADLEVPASVDRLREAIAAADGLVIATPEYNHSVPGVLKNALDWASRPAMRSPLRDKPALILSASPGALGGVRAQAHLRLVLESAMSPVFPGPEIVVTHARDKVGADGLTDPATRTFVREALQAYRAFVVRFTTDR